MKMAEIRAEAFAQDDKQRWFIQPGTTVPLTRLDFQHNQATIQECPRYDEIILEAGELKKVVGKTVTKVTCACGDLKVVSGCVSGAAKCPPLGEEKDEETGRMVDRECAVTMMEGVVRHPDNDDAQAKLGVVVQEPKKHAYQTAASSALSTTPLTTSTPTPTESPDLEEKKSSIWGWASSLVAKWC